MIRFAILILLVVVHIPAMAGTPRVADYRLNVMFQPSEASISARAIMTLDPASTVGDTTTFYLHGELHADSVIIGGQSVPLSQESVFYYSDYSLVANRVSIGISTPTSEVTVYYHGFFNPSRARSLSDYMRIDGDGVFLRSFLYSLWFPVLLGADEEPYETAFSSVAIKTPEEFIAVFAGERVDEAVANGWRVSQWTAPQLSLFDAQCTAQRFDVMKSQSIFVYSNSDSLSLARRSAVADFATTLSKSYADRYRKGLAGEQFHIMEMPKFGDIANGTVIGISRAVWLDFDSTEWARLTLAHELVHPFVHTDTKMADSLFVLAVEGFPSYFHYPALADIYGEEWYEEKMERVEASYLDKRRTGKGRRGTTLPVEIPLSKITMSQFGDYKDVFVLNDRALLFFHWLRKEMGKKRFTDFTRTLFETRNLTFGTFQRIILKFVPKESRSVQLWLCTTEFPLEFSTGHN